MESLADGAKSLIDDYNTRKKAIQWRAFGLWSPGILVLLAWTPYKPYKFGRCLDRSSKNCPPRKGCIFSVPENDRFFKLVYNTFFFGRSGGPPDHHPCWIFVPCVRCVPGIGCLALAIVGHESSNLGSHLHVYWFLGIEKHVNFSTPINITISVIGTRQCLVH